jgi:NhaP-type Na+/H+ or K+/H+ antiporter
VLSETEILISIATIAVLGVGAQWIGRRLGFPSLLLLLPAGLLAGDVLGLVEPEKLLGDLLFPLVTLLVSLLLFQSGLQLRFADLPKDARQPVVRLLTLGLLITFVGASLAALAILDIATDLAFLLGAIIVVSGPTVVGPLLATVRAREPTSSVLEYEGAFLDPLGATLGVVMLSFVLTEDAGDVNPLLQVFGRLGLGVAVGLVAAGLLVAVMSRFLLSFDMEAAVAVMLAVVAFVAADAVLSEAGLFATLTFGVAMANQRRVSLRTVRAFGGTLEVLIIGALFILLGALVTIDGLREYAWQIIALVAVLVILVRPLTAFVSLVRTKLSWRDRALISWVDPRGIVAASTAASFAGSLAAAGIASDFLLPVVFGVILGTGVVYGLSAKPLAGLLGVATPPPKGVVLLGNADWLLDLGRELTRVGASVLVITAESPETAKADHERAEAPVVSLRDSQAALAQAIRAADVAEVVICAPAYALLNVVDVALIRRYGRRRVLRLPDRRETAGLGRRVLAHRSAHPFAPGVTLQDIDEAVNSGALVRPIVAGDADALPLAAVGPNGAVNLRPGMHPPKPEDTLIGLGRPATGAGAPVPEA